LEDYGERIDPEGRHYLERVRAGAQRMGQLIQDLLRLAQISRAELTRVAVDLSALARRVVDELRQAQPERTVECIIAEGLVAEADPNLLQVVIENLLGNAWKYTSRQATARIEFGQLADGRSQMADGRISEARGGGAMPSTISHQRIFFVRDNGVGFNMAYADKLFGAFQRLHAASEFEGSGIGLATVQRIIHRHGGEIWGVGAPNQGSTFYFTLGEPPG
jgi:signal transduction histidine kinase